MDWSWPDPGQWFVEVEGEPLAAAARLLASELRDAPLGGPPFRVLLPDGTSESCFREWLRAELSSPVAPIGAGITPGHLAEQLLPLDPARDAVGEGVIAEIARAVDHTLRSDAATFPRLSAFPVGAALPAALARLYRDLRQTGGDARAAGSIAALERLEVGQELLTALGMMEGVLERLGWEDQHDHLRRATARIAGDEDALAGRSGSQPWLAAGFGFVPAAVIDLALAIGARAPVVWLVPAAPGGDSQAPDRRSLAWLGAARLPAPPSLHVAAEAPAPITLPVAGPADAAWRIAELAARGGTTLVLASEPAGWVPFFEEAAFAATGAGEAAPLVLAGEVGRSQPGPALRWLRRLVDAWAGGPAGLTAERTVDLFSLAARAGIAPWPDDPEIADRIDAVLCRMAVRAGREPILRALGRRGGPLADAFDQLDEAGSAARALRIAARLLRGTEAWRAATTTPNPTRARREADQVAALSTWLEDLAGRVTEIWPDAEPAHTPALLLARIEDGIHLALGRAPRRAAPAGAPTIRLESLDAPIPPGVCNVVLLAITEGDFAPSSGGTHLVPDRIRAHPAVASAAHWPWHVDRPLLRRRHVEGILGGGAGGGTGPPVLPVPPVLIVMPERSVMGGELVPWSGLPTAEEAEMTAISRSAPGDFPEVAVGREDDDQGQSAELLELLRRRAGLEGHGLSATAVDAFHACPRRYYFERLLRAEDRERVGYDPEARLRGTWVHDVIRQLFRANPGWWRTEPAPDDLLRMLAPLAETAPEELVAAAAEAFVRLQVDGMLRCLAAALADHGQLLAESPALRPAGFEVTLRAGTDADAEGRSLPLRGTVDRLDLVAGPDGVAVGFAVFDYKSGSVAAHAIEASDDRRSVQLLLYAWLGERLLGLPCLAGLAVPVLSEGKPRGFVLEDAPLPGLLDVASRRDRIDRDRLEAGYEEALARAGATAFGVVEGRFPAAPSSPDRCRYCPQTLYCPAVRR